MNDGYKIKYTLDKTGFFAESAVILFALSAIFRLIGSWGIWSKSRVEAILLLLLPVVCCVLMIVCILAFGKKGFFLSSIPVLLGAVFFVAQALSDSAANSSWIRISMNILLCAVVMVVYTATVFGWIQTKWLLPPLFGLPFLYKLILEDLPALANAEDPVTFVAGMEEMSVLGMLASMFCVGMGLKKVVAEKKKFLKKKEKAAKKAAEKAAEASAEPAAAAPAAPETVTEAAAAKVPADDGIVKPAETPLISDEPYTPVLTLNPEPLEMSDGKAEEKADDNGNE